MNSFPQQVKEILYPKVVFPNTGTYCTEVTHKRGPMKDQGPMQGQQQDRRQRAGSNATDELQVSDLDSAWQTVG